MHNLKFADAALLSLLAIALPLTAALWYCSLRLYRAHRNRYGEERLVDTYTKKINLKRQIVFLAGWLAAVALIVIAAAGPYVPAAPQQVSAGSMQVVAVLDVSRSMGATDYASSEQSKSDEFFSATGTRLGYAMQLLENNIMPAIINNQLGLVTYENGANTMVPLTNDFGLVSFILQRWIAIGQAPVGAANMGSGLIAAVDQFKHSGNSHAQKVIILFSDGEDASPSTLAKAEQEIAAMHIKLVVVGIGGSTPVPVPAYNQDGQFTGYYQDPNGQLATTSQNVSALETVAASVPGGTYINFAPGHSGKINWPSAVSSTTKTVVNRQLIYQYPLELALLLVILLGLKGAFVSFYRSKRNLVISLRSRNDT